MLMWSMQWAASTGELGLPMMKVEGTLMVRPLLRGLLALVTGGINIFNIHIYFFHTTIFEIKAGETYLTLSGLAPFPR